MPGTRSEGVSRKSKADANGSIFLSSVRSPSSSPLPSEINWNRASKRSLRARFRVSPDASGIESGEYDTRAGRSSSWCSSMTLIGKPAGWEDKTNELQKWYFRERFEDGIALQIWGFCDDRGGRPGVLFVEIFNVKVKFEHYFFRDNFMRDSQKREYVSSC